MELSEWEGGFLEDVAARVRTHGRAFADPEKGAPGQALSALQARKLKEIAAKARDEPSASGARAAQGTGRRPNRSGFKRRRQESPMAEPEAPEPADGEDGAPAPSATELIVEGHLGPGGDPVEGSDEEA